MAEDKKKEKKDSRQYAHESPFTPEEDAAYEKRMSRGHTKEAMYSAVAHAMLFALFVSLTEQVVSGFKVSPDDPTAVSMLGVSPAGWGIISAFFAVGFGGAYLANKIGVELGRERDDRHAVYTGAAASKGKSGPEEGKKESKRLRAAMRRLAASMEQLKDLVAAAVGHSKLAANATTVEEKQLAKQELEKDVAKITKVVGEEKVLADQIDGSASAADTPVLLKLAESADHDHNAADTSPSKWVASQSAAKKDGIVSKGPRTPDSIIDAKDHPPENRSENWIG